MSANPSPVFQTLVQKLAEHAAQAADEQVTRSLFNPSDEELDTLDPQAVAQAFDRQDLNSQGEEALYRDSMGVHAGIKLQVDIIAQAERAFALRHMSPVRARAHAAARRRGHGKSSGLFQGELLRYIQDVLASG